MQEGRALEADLDERALHAGQNARHPAQVDVADEPPRARALHVELLHDALLEHRDPGFLRRDVDEDLVAHCSRYSTGNPMRVSASAVSNSGRPITPE